MEKWLKIFLISFGSLLIVLAGIGAYAYISYKQITAVVNVASDESFQQNALALSQGDCSKYDDVEARSAEIKDIVKSACANPGVKILIEKEMKKYELRAELGGVNMSAIDICSDMDNPEGVYLSALANAKKNCNLSS
jgi:hypothetical protein